VRAAQSSVRLPITASYSIGHYNPGLEDGPDALLAALFGPGHARVDVPFRPRRGDESSLRRDLPGLTAAVRASSDTPVVALLGECSLAPAVLAGVQQRLGTSRVGCLYVDAHGDVNTPQTSLSGFIGGMPLAAICGRWRGSWLAEAAGLVPVGEELCVLVGARDLDPAETEYLEGSNLAAVADLQTALEVLPSDAPIHLHFDLDVMDPSVNRGVDLGVPGGWSVADVRDGLRSVLSSGRTAAVSVAWGIPSLDTLEGDGVRACAQALLPLLGQADPS
jgi:arginase